jgi:glycerophosphoryl diester phosphodiesterase
MQQNKNFRMDIFQDFLKISRPFTFVEIIAHRGASFDAPENTFASVCLGWQQRADAVEVDVHLSRDGKLVVIHDDNTRKTTGMNRKVVRQTLAELRVLDAGQWHSEEWSGEQIPTLDEILPTVPARKRLFIEIKSKASPAVELSRTLTRSKCPAGQIVFIGFSLPMMKSIKRAFPEFEVCWITVLRRNSRTRRWSNAAKLAARIKAAGLDGLDLQANAAITPHFVKTIRAAGLKLYVWTVDSPAMAKKLAEAGVDGITTNRPEWLRREIEGKSQPRRS